MGGAIEVRPDRGVVASPRADLPRPVGTRPRCADRLPRRLRPRRGGRAGGLRDRRRALAARRRPGQPRRLAGDDGPQPGHRPHPPRPRRWPRRPACSTCREAAEDDRWTTTTFPDERLELDLHLLPSGARHRRAGGADPAHARRPDHRRDRARVPGPRGDDGPAAGAGQAQDQGGRASRSACRPTTCCPTGSPPCSPSST